MTHRVAAERIYARNGITKPVEEIDVFEMYDPSSWWGLAWIREFLLLEGDEHLRMVENDEITINGKFPINPSGGVVASNPIGATALVRVAEAAMQIRRTAGKHQFQHAESPRRLRLRWHPLDRSHAPRQRQTPTGKLSHAQDRRRTGTYRQQAGPQPAPVVLHRPHHGALPHPAA